MFNSIQNAFCLQINRRNQFSNPIPRNIFLFNFRKLDLKLAFSDPQSIFFITTVIYHNFHGDKWIAYNVNCVLNQGYASGDKGIHGDKVKCFYCKLWTKTRLSHGDK